ncbi:MAG: N-acetylmuramoyl-L-alanine amidase [Actinomycetota bacterium]|nr:N-acetylmuramoyl-L-alanine amidase [Actinomycetota bacterium]
MSRLLWLADTLRDGGLTVLEHPGWKARGKDGMRPRVVIAHHTATHWTTPDSVVTNLLVNGRADLPGPLCHLGLNRHGHYIVIASGKANHAGAGSWMDANESVETIGIEAYNYGNSVAFPSREPWPQIQLDAYDRGVAALLSHIGRDYRHMCGHREWALPSGRKPDPSGIDLGRMRLRVADLLQPKGDTMILKPGTRGAHVKLWQAALNEAISRNSLTVPTVTVDGTYGDATKAAVAAYQVASGIGGLVPELGSLDDYTRDLLVEFTRADA